MLTLPVRAHGDVNDLCLAINRTLEILARHQAEEDIEVSSPCADPKRSGVWAAIITIRNEKPATLRACLTGKLLPEKKVRSE